MRSMIASTLALLLGSAYPALANEVQCGEPYSVVRGDTLGSISKRSYGSFLYQPIYSANIDTIGANPDLILIGQSLFIPCLASDGTAVAGDTTDDVGQAVIEDQLIFTFNKASAPPFIINSGIIDGYLAEITEATEGRVTFVDPEVINRDHAEQLDIVTSGQVDGAYVLNLHLAESHPLLQLPMQPIFGGSAEQVAVSFWRLHETYLSQVDYFPEAQLLGFVAAPAAHIWHEADMPISAEQNITEANDYSIPYFNGLDTRGPAVMRAEVQEFATAYGAQNDDSPIYFLAHGAAIALGVWNETSTYSVTEVDYGVYTPTFSVVLSNDAWAQISPEDQAAITSISGEALARKSAAWDDFDNSFRSRMLDLGLDTKKADKTLLNEIHIGGLSGLTAWLDYANGLGLAANEAANFYLSSLRSLEDRLVYRAQDGSLDNHPFVTGN